MNNDNVIGLFILSMFARLLMFYYVSAYILSLLYLLLQL